MSGQTWAQGFWKSGFWAAGFWAETITPDEVVSTGGKGDNEKGKKRRQIYKPTGLIDRPVSAKKEIDVVDLPQTVELAVIETPKTQDLKNELLPLFYPHSPYMDDVAARNLGKTLKNIDDITIILMLIAAAEDD